MERCALPNRSLRIKISDFHSWRSEKKDPKTIIDTCRVGRDRTEPVHEDGTLGRDRASVWMGRATLSPCADPLEWLDETNRYLNGYLSRRNGALHSSNGNVTMRSPMLNRHLGGAGGAGRHSHRGRGERVLRGASRCIQFSIKKLGQRDA
ncbi:hypothetical protein EVAR_103985_1 [Eumeta japonica]|uniref:Uncharacterized protein n=1 Tax=Eumeta variegata TaxID=151549 RepID=A0A4C1Y0U1_EUMVA|nr:hypothetical protein EVAR_103985_1 [Eumeta japonica]